MYICQICIFIIRSLHGTKFTLYKIRIQKQRTVLSVVIIKLRICNSSCKSISELIPSVHRMKCMAVNNRLQPHLPELKNSRFYHTLKAKMITYINRFLLCNIFSSCDESHPIAFCISTCHLINFPLGKWIHKFCCFQFIFRYIFAGLIQITQIAQIRIHDHFNHKIILRINRLSDPIFHHILAVVIHVGNENFFHLFLSRNFFLRKCRIDFQKQFKYNRKIPCFFFKRISNRAMKFCIKKGKYFSVFSQHFLCICRISIRIFIIFGQNILI